MILSVLMLRKNSIIGIFDSIIDADEICENLVGKNQLFGLENFEALLKILPDSNEIEILNGYSGDIDKLGQAEKFLLKLIKIPNYKLRIECLVVKEEFYNQVYFFNTTFDSVLTACEIVYENKTLPQFLLAGNFLNHGSYSGNAAGFKLSSLNKLCDIKSNQNSITLLQLIVQRLEVEKKELLLLPDEIMSNLKHVLTVQTEVFVSDFFTFADKVKNLYEQLFCVNLMSDLKDFFKTAVKNINELKSKENKFEEWNLKLANYFCEDPVSFRLEECFNILFAFAEKIKNAKSTKTEIVATVKIKKTPKANSNYYDTTNYLEELDGVVVNYRNSRARPSTRLSHPVSSFVRFLHDDAETNRELMNTSRDFDSVKSRRSLSSYQFDVSKLDNKKGKSMSLLEENENENPDQKKSNRLSGLRKMEEFQKLASMYKNFEQEDSNISVRTKSQDQKINLEEKLAFFENMSSDQNSKSKIDKQNHSSFVFPKKCQETKVFEVLRDEGFETQSNSSMSNTNEMEHKKEYERKEMKRRSVCPIIGRTKSCSKPIVDTRHSVYITYNDGQNIKSNNSLYMNETVSTKAKKTSIKLNQKNALQCQSKTKFSSKTNSESPLTKPRTISSSSSSTLGSQKLTRKNKTINEKSILTKMKTIKI
ncbi:FH2 domain-containing 1 [Brachionus plicatilis]|uniref:FH2 domain-containing 1 n=1 Tax=Brachionus plicatilis TaxID=10195 RepID=A0A3M7PWN2_BRAPC|nr:FH2 domain-containing 1 [Brachionus plicatilis]